MPPKTERAFDAEAFLDSPGVTRRVAAYERAASPSAGVACGPSHPAAGGRRWRSDTRSHRDWFQHSAPTTGNCHHHRRLISITKRTPSATGVPTTRTTRGNASTISSNTPASTSERKSLAANRRTRDEPEAMSICSVVQHDAQQRTVDLERELAAVVDEAELLEFVQKEVHARAGRADHLRERFL
jgi:hypothetical protein